jgi:hypothetical protein
MESVGDKKPSAVDQRRAYGLRVVLPKRTYVLPWAQFLYAEGAPDTVRAVFSMHDVVVTGLRPDQSRQQLVGRWSLPAAQQR